MSPAQTIKFSNAIFRHSYSTGSWAWSDSDDPHLCGLGQEELCSAIFAPYNTFAADHLGRAAVGALTCDNSVVDNRRVRGDQLAPLPIDIACKEALSYQVVDGG